MIGGDIHQNHQYLYLLRVDELILCTDIKETALYLVTYKSPAGRVRTQLHHIFPLHS